MNKLCWMLTGGFLAAILIVGIPLAVLASGVIDFSASAKPGAVEAALAPWALDRSTEHHAPKDAKNPLAGQPRALKEGLDHYGEMCVMCHGGPGVKPSELARGLNPDAPDLATEDVEETPDGELFYTIKHGIRMTGMPAFGPTHTDAQIWAIVAFVKHLRSLTDEEKAELKGLAGAGRHESDE